MNGHKALIQDYFRAFNSGDGARLSPFFTSDFLDHNGFANQRPGPEGVVKAYTEWLRAFPDTHVVIDDILVDGDKVVVRATMHATHAGAFAGLAPTGKAVTVQGISIFRISAGQIAERWGLTDVMGLYRQLQAGTPASQR